MARAKVPRRRRKRRRLRQNHLGPLIAPQILLVPIHRAQPKRRPRVRARNARSRRKSKKLRRKKPRKSFKESVKIKTRPRARPRKNFEPRVRLRKRRLRNIGSERLLRSNLLGELEVSIFHPSSWPGSRRTLRIRRVLSTSAR